MSLKQAVRFGFVSFTLLAVTLSLGGCPGATPPTGDGGGAGGDGGGGDGAGDEKSLHERVFTEVLGAGFTSPQVCMACHADHALDVTKSAHYTWAGVVANIAGLEGETHGKVDLINNFCIAVPSNEGRCTQCHPSFGWKDKSFDLTETDNVDCLVCHDTTGTYFKHPSAGGGGGPSAFKVEGEFVLASNEELQDVAYNVGRPGRQNCGFCHFNAGGGDNVKHGDLASSLVNGTREMDVHMGVDGKNFRCQVCHKEEDHGISGMPLHSVDEGGITPRCIRCHTSEPHEENASVAFVLNAHTDAIACETCHIPTFARQLPTKVEWYWSEAGQNVDPIPTDQYGKATYDKKKGRFVWGKNVKPAYMWFDGEWSRKVINVSDTYTEAGTPADPIIIAAPTATMSTPGAKIYPFKKMIGDQPVDPVNKILLVPHLFGKATGDNPYWGSYQWGPALADGAAYTGQNYSGTFDFANTVMYLAISHEIAPAENALACGDCHGDDAFFQALGYAEDPLSGF